MEAVRHWRLRKERYRLVGEACQNYGCGEKIFPPKDFCPSCGQLAHLDYKFSGKGEVYSFTTVYDAPAGYEEFVPYVIALIKLEEGPMVTAQLTDLDPSQPVEIGMPVEMVTRRLKSDGERGAIVYGYKFRPVLRQEPEMVTQNILQVEEPVSY